MSQQRQHDDDTEAELRVVAVNADSNDARLDEHDGGGAEQQAPDVPRPPPTGVPPTTTPANTGRSNPSPIVA